LTKTNTDNPPMDRWSKYLWRKRFGFWRHLACHQ